jgi:hypothetical protein
MFDAVFLDPVRRPLFRPNVNNYNAYDNLDISSLSPLMISSVVRSTDHITKPYFGLVPISDTTGEPVGEIAGLEGVS